jgi:hypothetical protein
MRPSEQASAIANSVAITRSVSDEYAGGKIMASTTNTRKTLPWAI